VPTNEEPVQLIQDAECQEEDESVNPDIEKVMDSEPVGLEAEDEDEEDHSAPIVNSSLIIPQPSFGRRQSSVSPSRKHSRGPSSSNLDKETVDDGRSVRYRTETPVPAGVRRQASTSGPSNPISLPSSPPSYQPPRVSEIPIGVPVSGLPSTPTSYQLPRAPTPSEVHPETPISLPQSDNLPPVSYQLPRAPSPSEVPISIPLPSLPSSSRSETPISLPQSLPNPTYRRLATIDRRRSMTSSPTPSSDNATSDAGDLEDDCGTETGGTRQRSKAKALAPKEQIVFDRLKPNLDLWWFRDCTWAGIDDVASFGHHLVPSVDFSMPFRDYVSLILQHILVKRLLTSILRLLDILTVPGVILLHPLRML
jgi:hypothetical protein